MSRLLIIRLVVAIFGGILGALVLALSPALAGNLVQVVSRQGGGSATSTALVSADSPFLIYLLLILFGFGGLLIGGLLFYVYKVQMRYYNLTQTLSQMGESVKAIHIPSIEGEVAARLEATVRAGGSVAQQQNLIIEGPGYLAVGTPADFTVKDTSGNPANTAQWSVTPDTVAKLSTNTGSKVTVHPMTMGSFKLNASLEAPPAADSVLVAVISPQNTIEELPFVGQGYGSLAIAILVIFAIIALALTGVLGSEAVATLFGGLLGYAFGVATTSGGTAPSQTAARGGGKSPSGS